MAIERIQVCHLIVAGKECRIFERVDVVRRKNFTDDDGRVRERVIGDRLGYVVTGSDGNLGLTDDAGFTFSQSLTGTQRTRNFAARRVGRAGLTVQWP